MKCLITWNSGYGQCEDVVDAATQEAAVEYAGEAWNGAVQSEAEYDAKPMTAELAEEYGLDFEEDE